MKRNMSFVNEYCINFDCILQAHQRIKKFANQTPVLTSTTIDTILSSSPSTTKASDHNRHQQQHTEKQFFFKVEALQRTGSFKFRGALNAVLSIVEQQQIQVHVEQEDNTIVKPQTSTSIVTHSSGNHAAAIACAADIASINYASSSCLKIQSTIVMPRNVTSIKKRAVEEYHGDIILVDNTNEARESMATRITQELPGAYFVHPSEDPRVIAGQGTVCVEFISQVREMLIDSDLDVVIIPVGGGGLASGNTIALRALLGNKIKVCRPYF